MLTKKELEEIRCSLPHIDSYPVYKRFIQESIKDILGEHLRFNIDFEKCYKVYSEYILTANIFSDAKYKLSTSYQHPSKDSSHSILNVYINDEKVVELKFNKHYDGKLNYSMLRDYLYSKEYYI